jgi:hypothetical protein
VEFIKTIPGVLEAGREPGKCKGNEDKKYFWSQEGTVRSILTSLTVNYNGQ